MSPFALILIVSLGNAASVTSVDMPSLEVCQRAREEAMQAPRFSPHIPTVSRLSFCLERRESR